MTKGLICDFYGTLVQSDVTLVRDLCRKIAKSAGAVTQEVQRFWWNTFRDQCESAFGANFRLQAEIETEAFEKTVSEYNAKLDPTHLMDQVLDFWRQPPILPETLQFLHKLELPICIVSNIDRSNIERAISLHRLKLPFVITSEDARAYKPKPEIFRAGLRELGCLPHEVFHVGDSLRSDVNGAASCGIPVVWMNRMSGQLPDGYAVHAEIDSLLDLFSLINTKNPPDYSGA